MLFAPTMVPDEVVIVHTEDGWELPLRHHAGDGPPVLLVHGLGANHYNWDFSEDVSLADALVDDGFDVWVATLRGDPGTTAPSRRERRSITFDDYAAGDMPALVHAVLDASDESRLHVVGHSLGGMLLYAWLAQEPETVASGVAIASPSQFDHQRVPWTVQPIRWALWGRGFVRVRTLAALSRPLGRHNPQLARIGNRDNLDVDVVMGLAKHALANIPKPLARQALMWARTDELLSLDGDPWVVDADVPLLVLGAPLDRVVAEPDVRATCDHFTDCTYLLLSESEGFAADYGHIDPVVGRDAREDVYPTIIGFLR